MRKMVGRALALIATLMLLSGSATIAQTPDLTTIRLISAPSDDMRPILYADKATVPNAGVIVAANSPIRSPLDLQGKVVACTAIGDIGYLGLRAMIDATGGDSAQVRWVEIPISSVAVAIEQGRVDAGLSTEPFMTKDLKGGKVRFLVDMLAGNKTPILESAFYATREYVAKNRDTVARFARVIREAAVYSNAHEEETVPLYAAFAGMEPAVAAQMHRTYTATEFDPRQIQPVIDYAAKYGLIPRTVDAKDLVAGAAR